MTSSLREKMIGPTRQGETTILDPGLRCTPAKYCRKSGGMMDVARFSAMAGVGDSLVVYDQNSFQRDTALVN